MLHVTEITSDGSEHAYKEAAHTARAWEGAQESRVVSQAPLDGAQDPEPGAQQPLCGPTHGCSGRSKVSVPVGKSCCAAAWTHEARSAMTVCVENPLLESASETCK
jgi:hypothetical protein